MAKIGRQGDGGGPKPIYFSQEQINTYERLASVLNKSELADYFGVSENTLRAIETRQPEVSAAYKKGRATAKATVASNLIRMAQRGNVTAAIFYLKTQAGWSESKPIDDETPALDVTFHVEQPKSDLRITKGS